MSIFKSINPLLLMLLILLLLLSIIIVTAQYMAIKKVQYQATDQSPSLNPDQLMQESQDKGLETTQSTSQESQNAQTVKFMKPMDDWKARVVLKPFGVYITPTNSPVSPERFTGYHSAVDLEIFLGEENKKMDFYSICEGEIKLKQKARGYGGLVAQYCTYNGTTVLVIYGHVDISSVSYSIGDNIKAGERLGSLGEVGPDTDNERKHLHLGIHKGEAIVTSGYVSTKDALNNFIDPLSIID